MGTPEDAASPTTAGYAAPVSKLRKTHGSPEGHRAPREPAGVAQVDYSSAEYDGRDHPAPPYHSRITTQYDRHLGAAATDPQVPTATIHQLLTGRSPRGHGHARRRREPNHRRIGRANIHFAHTHGSPEGHKAAERARRRCASRSFQCRVSPPHPFCGMGEGPPALPHGCPRGSGPRAGGRVQWG